MVTGTIDVFVIVSGKLNGVVYQGVPYAYTLGPPKIISPAPGSVLPVGPVTFTTNGVGDGSAYAIAVGTVPWAQSCNSSDPCYNDLVQQRASSLARVCRATLSS